MQEDGHPGKPHDLEIARLDRGAAERHEKPLVGLDIPRVEMQMPHRHAHFVGRHRLGEGRSAREA
jgi:hypothetical protein